jgi:hypothetical protein
VQTQESARVRETITVITVSDYAKSKEWYSQSFAKGPDLEPFPGNVEHMVISRFKFSCSFVFNFLEFWFNNMV